MLDVDMLTMDVYGLRQHERLAPPVAADEPGWDAPFAKLAWRWLALAIPREEEVLSRRVCCVPVWHAVSEEQPTETWGGALVVVGDDGFVQLVQEPQACLKVACVVDAMVTVAVRVVATSTLGHEVPLQRVLGPFAVVRKRVALDGVSVTLSDGQRRDPPPRMLEPWTQQVALAIEPESIPDPFREQVLEQVKLLSDDP